MVLGKCLRPHSGPIESLTPVAAAIETDRGQESPYDSHSKIVIRKFYKGYCRILIDANKYFLIRSKKSYRIYIGGFVEKSKEVLSVVDLAQELNVGLALAYNLVREGTVPSQRIGRKYVISRKKFERWLHGETEVTHATR